MTLLMRDQEMIKKGRAEGLKEGMLQTLFALVTDGILTISEAAKRAGMTETLFKENMEKFKA